MADRLASLKTRLAHPFSLFGAPSKDKDRHPGKGHGMDICVGNLPSDLTARDLREIFEFFGCVETAQVVKPRSGEESKGWGLVGNRAIIFV